MNLLKQQDVVHPCCYIGQHLTAAATDLGRAPAAVIDISQRLPNRRPIDVAVANFCCESALFAPVLDIELYDAIAERTNPVLARAELATIADVEPGADPRAADRVDVIPRLLRRLTKTVPHIFDANSHAELAR